MNSIKTWLVKHPIAFMAILVFVSLVPFIDQAIQTDDALFVWSGQWIQKHPIDFFGSKVNWWFSAIPMWVANWNPPTMSYFLAALACLLGWSEFALHLGCFLVAFVALLGVYTLAKRWCSHPLLAAIMAFFTPAFLVSSTTLMCDVLMLMFWVWAMVLWDTATANRESRWLFMWAGVLAGMAVLTKFSAITLLPLLPLLSVLKMRKVGWWVLGLMPIIIMVVGYELATTHLFGTDLLAAASYHARTFRAGLPGGWKASIIIGLTFAGGSLLPLIFLAPLLWKRRTFLIGASVVLGGLMLLFRLNDNLGLVTSAGSNILNQWSFQLEMAFLAAGGLHLLLLIGRELRHWRDPVSVVLVAWIACGSLFATVLNWTINARSFLPVVPAVAILLVRRLDVARGSHEIDVGCLLPLVPTAMVTLSVAAANYQSANSGRTAAEQITAKYEATNSRVWFEGHGGFQYYMEKAGGQPIDVERSLLQPGDIVVVPEIGIRIPFQPFSVGWLEQFQYRSTFFVNVMGGTAGGAAGFHGAIMGPAPFAFGWPEQNYFVARVFSRIQFNSRAENPQAV